MSDNSSNIILKTLATDPTKFRYLILLLGFISLAKLAKKNKLYDVLISYHIPERVCGTPIKQILKLKDEDLPKDLQHWIRPLRRFWANANRLKVIWPAPSNDEADEYRLL